MVKFPPYGVYDTIKSRQRVRVELFVSGVGFGWRCSADRSVMPR